MDQPSRLPRCGVSLAGAVLLLAGISTSGIGATVRVPEDQPSIQAGIDAASTGDTVLVACGTYYEHDIDISRGLCLVGAAGSSGCVTVDAQQQGRVFKCDSLQYPVLLSNLTIKGGLVEGSGWPNDNGGGLLAVEATLNIRGCRFESNIASGSGGGLAAYRASIVLEDCVFFENRAGGGGGASFSEDSPEVRACLFLRNTASGGGGGLSFTGQMYAEVAGCTFHANSAPAGAAVYIDPMVYLYLNTSIIHGSTGPGPVWADGPHLWVACSDLFDNEGGDWTGALAGFASIEGNLSADPLFCAPESDDLTLGDESPCAPGNHPLGFSCGLIGALPVACGAVPVAENASWGAIKVLY